MNDALTTKELVVCQIVFAVLAVIYFGERYNDYPSAVVAVVGTFAFFWGLPGLIVLVVWLVTPATPDSASNPDTDR